jgi:predicted DNA-binding transcriptional regulator AlpA
MSDTTTTPQRQLGDVKADAGMLDVSPKTVRRLADAGKIPGRCRLGRLLKFDLSQVSNWIAQGCPPLHRFNQSGGDLR